MTMPRVLIAIHAKQAAGLLPFYLACIEAQDYPKDRIGILIRTNNNTDATVKILAEWKNKVSNDYMIVKMRDEDFAEPIHHIERHEWNAERFLILGAVRYGTIANVNRLHCDFYFTADVDNFLHPHTLRTLVSLNLPIVAPFLKNADCAPGTEGSLYSNFHDEVDAAGYLVPTQKYHWLFNQQLRGIIEVPVVHCTYLVRADAIPHLLYQDGTGRHEYVIFSDSARKAGIKQYLDNREVYGWLTFDADSKRAEEAMKR